MALLSVLKNRRKLFLFLMTFSLETYVGISSMRNSFERLNCIFFFPSVSQDSGISQEENPEEDKTVSVLPNTESGVSVLSLVFIRK